MLVPWGLAIMPIYTQLWEEHGEARTQEFLGRSLRYYVLLGAPIVAGLSAVGPDLLTLLAAEKYRAGARVIPAVIAGLVSSGAVPILGAGVFIKKRTWVAAGSVVVSTVLNMLLNFILLPRIGIQGAALATLVSYLLFVTLMARAGARHMRVPIPWSLAARAIAAALVMYAVVVRVELAGHVPTLAAKVAVGAAVYGLLVLAVEKTAREGAAAALARVRGA
jgi:O-antigen/teichoic acid export membrane protein